MDQMNMNIDLKNTESVEHKNGKVWAQRFIIRKISKFVTGTAEDALIPIPVMYNVSTNKILLDMIPKEIRDDYKDIGFTLGK